MKALKKEGWFKGMSVLLVAVVFVATSGCGAMFKGTSQAISINSDPNQAHVTITPVKKKGSVKGGPYTVITPGSITLDKKSGYSVQVEKEGYETQVISVIRKPDSASVTMDILWVILLAPYLFFIPLVIDGPTGAWYNLEPNSINVILKPGNVDGGTVSPAVEGAPDNG